MIIEFSIKNFGPIKKEQTLSFEATKDDTLQDYYVYEALPGLRLLKFAVLYGPNASGKSTILEALDFLRDLVVYPEDKKTNKLSFEPFLFDENTPSEPSELKLSFVKNKIKHNYHIVFTKDFVLKEVMQYYPKGRSAEFFSRTTNTENKLSEISFGSTVKISKKDLIVLTGNTISNNSILGAYNKSNVDIPELDIIFDWFKNNLMASISPNNNLFGWTSSRVEDNNNGFRDKVLELVRKADVQIDDIEIDVDEEELSEKILNDLEKLPILPESIEKLKKDRKIITKDIVFHHKVKNHGTIETYRLKNDMESLGTMRYYELSGVLATLIDGDKIASIDELETSLHSDLMIHFILVHLMNSTSSQLLTTTHNISLFLESDVLRRDAIWFTQKLEDGSTELYSLDDFDSSVLRKGGSIINSYRIGKLGAKPNLGSYYLNSSFNGKEKEN